MNRKIFLFVALLAAVLIGYRPAWSQVETGTINGTVTDSTGAVIPGATVTAKNVATGATRTVQTGTAGDYIIPALEPAIYEITVTSGNFAPFTGRAEVTVGGKVTVDAQLSVSGKTTTVEVVGEGGAVVNTQTQELSQIVNTEQMAALPSLTRNPYDFVGISGNVSSGDNSTNSMTSSQNLSSRGVGFAINGQRESGTEILLDGIENEAIFGASVGEQVPIDSVQEYSVVTNNFSPDYGRASGGIVNLTTKSGTNEFHGSGWEFNRLSAYTSNTDNNVANDLPKGVYTRNQFGFQGGGPLIKDKLFVFESTEWTRVRSAAVETELIPTPEFLSYTAANVQSYFSTYGATPYAITTTYNQSDLGIAIPGVPASTPILGQVNFKAAADAGGDDPQNTYRLVGRVDYNLSDKTTMFFRVGREESDFFAGTAFYSAYPQYDVGTAVGNNTFLYSLNHVFNPNLLSSTKISFTRLVSPNSYNTAYQNVPGLMFEGATAEGLPIQFPGLENFMLPGDGGLPFGGPQNTVQLEQDLSWTKGKHALHFGGQFTYIQLNVGYGAYAQAVEVLPTDPGPAFDAMMTGTLDYYEAAIDPEGALPCTSNPDGSLNQTPECSVTPPLGPPSFYRSDRYKDWALYAMDSFRVTPRLTINYGLRYEHFGVQHNNHQDLDSNFYEGPGSNIYEQIASGQVYLAPDSPVGQMWKPRWGTAAPRVGFAYDVFGDGKTSLRGGFGISYERNFGNVTFNTIQNPPNYGVLEVFDTPVTNSNVGPLGTPGPPVPLPNLELRNVNPNINVAQTQFWSLALQRQLARNTILEVSYSGAHGVHLYDIIVGNPIGGAQEFLGAPLITGGDCPYENLLTGEAECLTRPNDQYAGINVRGSGGTSSYNGLNIKLQSQNLHNTGFSIVTNYTWSHSLDDLSSAFSDSSQGGSGYIGNLGYLDSLDPKLDWGSSDFDVRNRIAVAPIWETPWYKEGRDWQRQVLGGWTISSIITARTGTPFSAYDYTYNLNGYAGVARVVPSTPITSYKPSAAVAVGPNEYQIGLVPGANDLEPFNTTLGISDFGPFPANMTRRNAFVGPGAWNTDFAIQKSFKLTERFDLAFRAEAFDLFNHSNLFVEEAGMAVDNLTPDGLGCGCIGAPLPIIALKGGLNTIALGGNHDERRFGQFSLRLDF